MINVSMSYILVQTGRWKKIHSGLGFLARPCSGFVSVIIRQSKVRTSDSVDTSLLHDAPVVACHYHEIIIEVPNYVVIHDNSTILYYIFR